MSKSHIPVRIIFAVSIVLILISLIIMMTLTPPPKPKATASAISVNVNTTDMGGDFVLNTTAGSELDSQSLRGKLLLIYFGYTRCPDICPASLTEIISALDNLGPFVTQVQPIFITIDPKRDTPQDLDNFFKNFDQRILPLTGAPTQVAEVAKKFKVYYSVAQDDKTNSKDYLVNHSSLYYLVSREGKLIKYYTPNATGKEIAEDILTTQR